jgi:hypothetical protein
MQAGGIATVSNFGTFGMEWGTPIPLPDQTLLLGLGAGKKVPRGMKKEFIPKPSKSPVSITAASTAAAQSAAQARSSCSKTEKTVERLSSARRHDILQARAILKIRG